MVEFLHVIFLSHPFHSHSHGQTQERWCRTSETFIAGQPPEMTASLRPATIPAA